MADDNGYIGKTLEDIKAQIRAKIADAARLLPTANHLAEMIGAPIVALGDFIGEHEDAATFSSQPTERGATSSAPRAGGGAAARSIKPDTFLGQPPLDAGKRYIGMVGHAAHIDEITAAVERGGAAIKGADWRDKLEMGLLRSTHDVIKVQDKTYGLVSFYSPAQIEGLRGVRRREKPKSKRAKNNKSAPKPPHKTAQQKTKTAAKPKVTAPDTAAPNLDPPTDPVH